MKARLIVMALSVTVGIAGGLLAVQNQQQEEKPDVDIEAGDVDVEADVQEREQRKEREQLRETSLRQDKPLIHRASALIGLEVQNPAGKDLGEIEDLTIDGKSGKVEYAAVSFGGFAGVGDKLFAVPWEAIQIKQMDPSQDEWVAIMDVSEQTLENAQGFDKDNWPNMADERWKMQNDRAFRAAQRDREATTPQRQ